MPRSLNRMVTGFAAIAALLALGTSVAFAQAPTKTLKFVPHADLRSLDPVWTTAYITRNHGYMVYDTLFAVDADSNVKPQMVDTWSLSPDKLTYTFRLRDGLKFHDGQPVGPADAIASVQRWGKRDSFGQKAMEMIAAMTPIDAKTFTIAVKQPFPLILDALAKPSSNVPFILPERLAKTDPFQQVTDATGSGPFKFVKEEWVPGNKVVYVKNTDYVPRKEPPSWASGGKVVKVDRIEWIYLPDTATAANALVAGEVDWWEQVAPDLIPVLERNRDIKVDNIDPVGNLGMIRFNQLHPPFNNLKMRQALLHVVDQRDYLLAIIGDPKRGRECFSVFPCGTPLSTEVAADPLKGPRSLEKAKQLIKDAGYNNEKIVILTPTDYPTIHPMGLITADLLRKLGLNIELAASDWSTLITRRSSREPVDKGGWSIFHTWWVGPDLFNPAVNAATRGNGLGAWFGWPTDETIEKLRDNWFLAPDLETQQKIAADIQKRAFEMVPWIPTAQFVIPTGYRKNIEGVIIAPVVFLWNVEKK